MARTGATVGTVDVSNTTHTNAATYASDYWTWTCTAKLQQHLLLRRSRSCIDKADATVVVTP